jgi:probable HAF family extracellular repeat protein
MRVAAAGILFLAASIFALSLSVGAQPKPSDESPYQYSIVPKPRGLAALEPPGVRAINDAGNIVGYTTSYEDGVSHGFLLRHGFCLTLDVPGAVGEGRGDGTIKPGSTFCMGINDRDDVVGYFTAGESKTGYSVGGGSTHGFLYRRGTYTVLDVPGSVPASTRANGINNQGDIVGEFVDAKHCRQGFLLRQGVYITLSLPKADMGTVAVAINDWDQVIGSGTASRHPDGSGGPQAFVGISGPGFAGYAHCFLWDHGAYTIIEPIDKNDNLFHVDGINNQGQIVGGTSRVLANTVFDHGFLYSNGVYTILDNPDRPGLTSAWGINNAAGLRICLWERKTSKTH